MASGELLSSTDDAAQRHDVLDARRGHCDLGGLAQRGIGAFERGAVRQLHADHQVALILVGNERGRQAGDAPGTDAGRDQGDHDHDAGAMDHEADDAGISILELVVDLVEAAEEDVALLRRCRRPQPHGALGGLQGGGVDGADQGRGGDDQGELGEHLAGQAGQEGRRQEYRHQHQGDADDRPEQLVHRLDRRVVGRHTSFDVMGDTFDDHDRIVDHDTDRQHDAEHGCRVDGESERRHGREGANDRHGNRRRGHQHCAPVLQEDHDHDQDQDARLDQGHEDLVDRCIHEARGVERHLVGQALREGLGQFDHLGLDALGDVEGIGIG